MLRHYQADAVAAIRMAFATHRRVLFVSPTGSGKTVIFAYITTNAVARGNGVIILAHRVEIVDQISAALSGLDVRHGRVQPGYSMTGHPVQVGMVQSVAKRLESIDEPSLLIVDEASTMPWPAHGRRSLWRGRARRSSA